MWNRIGLKEDSKTLLRLNYWPFVLVAFIHTIVVGSSARRGSGANAAGDWRNLYEGGYSYGYDSYYVLRDIVRSLLPFFGLALVTVMGLWVIMILLDIFVLSPIEVGCKRYMTMARSVKPEFGEMAFVFKNCYANVVKTMFLKSLYTFLWTLLFVIPGVVKAYEYRMIPYLMAEYPDMASDEAFRISREMMTGNKWEAFVLDLSFIGWNLLSTITLGLVGVFYAGPYQMLTNAALYLTLKETHPSFGYVQQDDNYYFQN
ncbi:MAG: DUF975 family protein [Eubacterium sp.]|nr:DUF975 family protein [Eubacterium sp.]